MAEPLNDPTQRVEATTTPEGAKGWEDQAGSAQVLAGGHGLDVAPDAHPEGVRAETRRLNDGAGGEPSNAPAAVRVGTRVAYVICPGEIALGVVRELNTEGQARIAWEDGWTDDDFVTYGLDDLLRVKS